MAEPSVVDIIITDELVGRPSKNADYLQEKRALQELAVRMAERPAEVLPCFVSLAMEMVGGASGGLSLYEEKPSPGVFRWKYLCGRLAPFEGETTPRHSSPCGITLDRNAPVLALHPERVYDWISDAGIVVPEVLLVPLYIGSTEPLGTLWIVSDEEGHFNSGHARAITELASFVGIALHMLQHEKNLERALGEQETLTREMSHRVKNLFAIVDAMVRVSARRSNNKDEMVEALTGRLHALAAAHTLIRRDFSDVPVSLRTPGLDELLQTIVRPHEGADPGVASRISLHGPTVPCGDHAVNSIALIFHELATNAAKYGALSTDEGRIDIGWRRENGNLIVRWAERRDEPITVPPVINGFGSTLIRATVGQLGGTLEYDWADKGLTVTITIPAENISS